jgi:hypothetical protein
VYADLWLHMRRAEIAGVFTGSSQEGLAQPMNTAGAPMHQFAQMLDFPFLGDEFLRLLADHFRKVHPGKKLDLADLRTGFGRLGFRPGLVRDVVKAMLAEGITELGRGINHCMASDQQSAVCRALLNSRSLGSARSLGSGLVLQHSGAWGGSLWWEPGVRSCFAISQCKT